MKIQCLIFISLILRSSILFSQTKSDVSALFDAYASMTDVNQIYSLEDPQLWAAEIEKSAVISKEDKARYKDDWGRMSSYVKQMLSGALSNAQRKSTPEIKARLKGLKISYSEPKNDLDNVSVEGKKIFISPQLVKSLLLHSMASQMSFLLDYRKYKQKIDEINYNDSLNRAQNPGAQYYYRPDPFDEFLRLDALDILNVCKTISDDFAGQMTAVFAQYAPQ